MSKTTISFWDNNHPTLQEQYNELVEALVPASGPGETVEAEAIRSVARLFHDYCNNGNCNAGERETYTETTYEYAIDDDGEEYEEEVEEEVEGDVVLNPYYEAMLEHLRKHVPGIGEAVDRVEALITDDALYYNYTYSQEEMEPYNQMTEITVKWVLAQQK